MLGGVARRWMGRIATGAVSLGLGVAALANACGTDAVGVDACTQIEETRCRRAPGCGIAIDPPHTTHGDPVDECIRFYDVACLHGLAVADPGGTAVSACVSALAYDAGCAAIADPGTQPACAWLGTRDAASPGDAGDAPDAGDASDADAAPDAASAN